MAILHKNISAEGDIHNPKWFSGANNGDVAWRNELGVLESTDELVLPAALDFVDGSIAPPTSNSGDIYVLSSGGSVNAGWGTVALGDWVRYDGTTWNVITPQKSSLCYNETTDALNSFDGSAWSSIGGSFGKFAISDANGSFTYYDSIELALSASSSGDIIEQFSNISVTGTTTINLVDGVTWQMNGYEYKNIDVGQVRMFTLPASCTVKILNGKIFRNGGGAGNSNTPLYNNQTSSTLIATNTTFESVNSSSIFASCKIIDGLYISSNNTYNMININGIHINVKAEGQGQNYIVGATALVYNSYYNSTGSNNFIDNGAKAYNCTFKSTANVAAFINSGSNEAHGCSFFSSASTGVTLKSTSSTVFSKLFNCSVVSSGGKAIDMYNFSEVYNCTFYSTANIGLNIRHSAKAFNTTIISSSSKGVSGTSDFTLVDCICKSTFDNSTGHAIEAYTTNTSFTIVGGYAETINSSANGLNIASTTNGRWAGIKFKGMTIPVVFTNANQMTNTPDAYGNILIG